MKRYLLGAATLLLMIPAVRAQTKRKDIGDQTSWFRNIVIQPDESADDIVCFGCSVRVLGEVRDDIVAMGGNIDLQGNVGDDAVALGGRVHVGTNVHIGDDADAFGGYVTQDGGARVNDEALSVPYFFVPGQAQPPLKGIGIIAGLHLVVVFVFALILRRERVENIYNVMLRKKIAVLLWGAVAWIVAIALLWAGLMIDDTQLGDTGMYVVSGITLLAMALAVNSGLTGVSVWVGRTFSYHAGWLKAILMGTIVILLLEVVPLLGFAVLAMAAWLSMGAALVSRWRRRSNEIARNAAWAD